MEKLNHKGWSHWAQLGHWIFADLHDPGQTLLSWSWGVRDKFPSGCAEPDTLRPKPSPRSALQPLLEYVKPELGITLL